MRNVIVQTILLALFFLASQAVVLGETEPVLDIVVVLDNSASMRSNDPDFLTKQAVSNFLDGLGGDSRVSFVIFAERADLAMPLSFVSAPETQRQVLQTLERINYGGQFTNIPAAIERAIYELERTGREDAEKLIIFMTDGIIDTGEPARDAERYRWLKEGLTEESKQAGIRIFGIAFTDQADFELIQSLGLETKGGYFRAYETKDLLSVFAQIHETILTPTATPTPDAVVEAAPAEEKGSALLLAIVLVALALMGLVPLLLMKRKRGEQTSTGAELWDRNKEPVADKPIFRIDGLVTRIGRVQRKGVSISIDKSTVSDPHAEIQFKDSHFYITDLDSTNGTFINGEKERIPKFFPVPLKHGDLIYFDQYKFEFVIPSHAARGKTEINTSQIPNQTILRVSKSKPRISLKKSNGAQSEQPVTVPQPEENLTVKPDMCQVHPSFHSTWECPECGKSYCLKCLVVRDGKRRCLQCAKQQSH